MKNLIAAVALATCALSCAQDDTWGGPALEPSPTTIPLALSDPCVSCIAALGGGMCADELDACSAHGGCADYFGALWTCELYSSLWSQEETEACAAGAIWASSSETDELALQLYCCTWGRGNAPQEWLDCLHGGPSGCNDEDNAIISHLAGSACW